MPFIEAFRHASRVFLVAQHFFPLENDAAYLIRSICCFKESIDKCLRCMGHIERTKHHIETMGRCLFHRIFENSQRRGDHLFIDTGDFQSFRISNG